ncbi:phosphatidylserine decarboxylase [Neobacillus thermocopriae]|uniref:Phosphatidylserine decarboxylase proenzyme n=1 Tax=Neobacillus thermocopriae TaxID=1215031 RepID=A0A6B3TTG0_9BACI|nr:phosphatidylserine decarboxylase [Neobacillus thermocopriae]MED3624511.1 phosphatidylserine decarboxylase [Neobacillus thermocopriae]MED3715397.1 phosphatidylserine decarboxylase [Neobacillus thermocopriae]NEX79596.1 phosphatidylserine decarboxylase [Neobacillus thermocopriae]
MIQILYRLLIELTNGRYSSALLKRFTKSRASRFIIPSFVRVYRINKAEMEKELHEFQTLHDLFIRKLKKEVRTIDKSYNTVVSPVDAVLEDMGTIRENSDIIVKGKTYSVEEMLGDRQVMEKYLHGSYLILYLSPSHYHRIHSPVSGTVKKQWTLGRKSYPVNKWGLKYGVRTLAKNYRVITEVETEFGHVAIVKVGAMFVNSIETIHKGSILEKGEEVAYFTFGSTVVLLFERNIFNPESLNVPREVKVGEKIGVLHRK